MSDVGGHDSAQELARELGQCVARALDESLPSRSMDGARRVAQLVPLAGLERLLSVLAQYAGGTWPGPLRPVVERVQRAAAECVRTGQIDVFRRMDDELGLMARAIERVPLARLAAPGTPRPDAGTLNSSSVSLADALEGVPGERADAELMRRVQLRTPVAGALRAALDWLVGGSQARMRMWLSSDGSALDVVCEGIAYNGIQPAADVLASVGAHLGPAGERPGAWTVRVPIRAERETFLMLEQDELQLAVPWHAVVRVRLIPADTIEMMLRRQPLPVLTPLAASTRRMAEQPVVVVALGLKRACLVADRLVWRMAASPADVHGAPPADGIRRVVQSDDGEVHWVLEPEFLLRGIAAPALGQAVTPQSPPPATPPPSLPVDAAPVPRAPLQFPERPGAAPAIEPLAELGPEHVEAFGDTPPMVDAGVPEASATTDTSVMTEVPPTVAQQGAQAPPVHDAAASRRALVAEDSIAARIYLVRLLEQRGYLVHGVATAAELRGSLTQGPWSLICADGALPDGRDPGFMSELAHAATVAGATLVALVHDAADERDARDAGVVEILRKPFERDIVGRLLDRLTPETTTSPEGSPDASGHDPDPREWGAR